MLRRIFLGLALAVSSAGVLAAQNYDWRTVLGQAVNVQMKINQQYEVAKERLAPVHFTMGVPLSEGNLITRSQFPKKEGNLAVLVFLSPDEKLMEYVTITSGTVLGDTEEVRLQNLYSVIETQVYPSLKAPDSANVLGGRIAKVAGRPAVEFLSLFEHPTHGPVAARIVGVISPNDHHVVFMVQQTMRDVLDLSGPDELSATFAGATLESTTFQAYRDNSGALIEF